MSQSTPAWESDEGLLLLLSDALKSPGDPNSPDDAPDAVKRAAYEAFTWRTIDAELASLAEDALADASEGRAEPALTRSVQADVTALTLASPSVTFELQVLPGVVLGQMIPAGAHRLEVQRLAGHTYDVPVDELGCFTLEPVPGGLFRLRLDGDSIVTTSWITLP